MKLVIFILSTIILSVTASFADPIADLANAKCVKCHGDKPGMPSLGGQTADYLFSASKAYQNGDRHEHFAVWYMAKRVNYSDATLKGLAEFFSTTPTATPVAGDPDLTAKGKEIYDNGIPARNIESCSGCHGDDGEGMGKFPRVAGLPPDFHWRQLKNYRDGLVEKQKAMTAAATGLTDDEIWAIAIYMRSK